MYEVHLEFNGNNVLQIGADFCVRAAGEAASIVDPVDHSGDMRRLWASIGSRIEKVVWNDTILVLFSNGVEIEIPPKPGRHRGALLGPHPYGTGYDEF